MCTFFKITYIFCFKKPFFHKLKVATNDNYVNYQIHRAAFYIFLKLKRSWQKTLNKLNASSISMAPQKYHKFIAINTITQ